jgi:hypothetical protein
MIENAANTHLPIPARKPRRHRWFQFSLRTLMIVVTLMAIPCAYIGWQARIVQERKAMLAEINGAGGVYLTSEYNAAEREEARTWAPITDREHWFHEKLISLGQISNDPAFLRTLLGDESVCQITLPITFSPGSVAKVETLFGEAIIEQSTYIQSTTETTEH